MTRFAGEELPVTDEIARTSLALPIGPELTQEQVTAVVDACCRRGPRRRRPRRLMERATLAALRCPTRLGPSTRSLSRRARR